MIKQSTRLALFGALRRWRRCARKIVKNGEVFSCHAQLRETGEFVLFRRGASFVKRLTDSEPINPAAPVTMIVRIYLTIIAKTVCPRIQVASHEPGQLRACPRLRRAKRFTYQAISI